MGTKTAKETTPMDYTFDGYVRELAIELTPAERHAHRVLVGLGK